jgi:hypothetical protein
MVRRRTNVPTADADTAAVAAAPEHATRKQTQIAKDSSLVQPFLVRLFEQEDCAWIVAFRISW